jgi:hypothetical protein
VPECVGNNAEAAKSVSVKAFEYISLNNSALEFLYQFLFVFFAGHAKERIAVNANQ